MHKEHQTPSPEQLDKKVLAVLKAQRGLTLSMLLTVVRGATGKTLSESLKRSLFANGGHSAAMATSNLLRCSSPNSR